MKADPASTDNDLWQYAHDAEAALRRANGDQYDALQILAGKPCTRLRKLLGKCGG